MSIRSVLKAYFNTGDKPTEAEFADFIDSDYNLDDDTSDVVTEGASNLFLTTTERSKLSGIEALAEVNNMSDVNATELTDGSETALHSHAASLPPEISLQGAGYSLSNVTGSTHTILWNVQIGIDTDYFTHDTVTNSDRVYVDVDGKYSLNVITSLTGTVAVANNFIWTLNGVNQSSWIKSESKIAYAANTPQIIGEINLSAGDYVSFIASAQFPGAAGVSSGLSNNTFLIMKKID